MTAADGRIRQSLVADLQAANAEIDRLVAGIRAARDTLYPHSDPGACGCTDCEMDGILCPLLEGHDL